MRNFQALALSCCPFAWGGVPLAAMLLVLAGPARADILDVDCASGESLQAAIDSLDRLGPHTIRVSGTCVEHIVISERERLVIEAPEGQSASIARPAGGAFPVVAIHSSHDITLRRLGISGGGIGVFLERAFPVTIDSSTIENNSRNGVTVFGPSSELIVVACTIRNNARAGIGVALGTLTVLAPTVIENNTLGGVGARNMSYMEILGGNDPGSEILIRNNGGAGVGVSVNSAAFVEGQTRIENNLGPGLRVVQTSTLGVSNAIVRGNSGAGLLVNENSSLMIGQGNDVSSNTGPGILVDTDGNLSSEGGNTINNNTGDGVRLAHQALANFLAPDTLFGNGNAAISCDNTSLLLGDLTNVSPLQCSMVERRPRAPGGPGGASGTGILEARPGSAVPQE